MPKPEAFYPTASLVQKTRTRLLRLWNGTRVQFIEIQILWCGLWVLRWLMWIFIR